jgi:hypothetical protein
MRYIDADALIKKIYPIGIGDGKYTINAKAVKLAIDNAPTADVVPKSEVDEMKIILATYGLQDRIRLAMEIFEEIDGITDLFAKGLIGELEMYDKLAELKKKYIGGDL